MTDPGHDRDHDRWPDELAAYVLGALNPDEAREVERHLEACQRCQAGLRWMMPAINALPEAVERVQPPASLRTKLINETKRDAAEQARATAARHGSGFGARLADRLRGSGKRPLALGPAFGLLVVALAVVAVAGYELGTTGSGESGGGGASNGGQVATFEAGRAPGVVARVIRREGGSGGTLKLANVRPLQYNRVLEAWVQRGEKVMPVRALFVPDDEGRATTMLPDMKNVSAVMVTIEPRGGSDEPTSTPIAAVPIPVKTTAG
jgi:anti-sigma-K factor RskA